MRRLRNGVVAAGLLAGAALNSVAGAQEAATSPTLTLQVDVGAKLFLGRCTGCHTVGGAQLTGPELTPATRWARADLRAMVKRMEAKAGPLKDEEIDAITDMLGSGRAKERIDAQQKALAAASEVKLSAPSAAVGESLFRGTRGFTNGGTSCSACHTVAGIGGNFGPDLSSVANRMPEMALRSGIENAAYRVMKPLYERRPLTAQEAAHVAAYLKQAAASGGGVAGGEPPVALMGLIGAGGCLGLLAVLGRRRAAGTRQRLIQQANKR